jgi:MFS family permease
MEVVSGLGDGVFWVGLAAILLARGVGAQGFAVAAVARLGPRALISAPAGVLADRVDRRRLLVTLDLTRAILLVALALAAASGAEPVALLALVFVSYTVSAPYRPALTAALPLVAGEDRLSSANALISTIRQLMTFIGPLVGAVVLHFSSPRTAFLLDAASFVVAGALIATIAELAGRPTRRALAISDHRATWRDDVVDGWREVAATAGLVVVAALVFAMYAARGSELVLFVLFSDERLGLGASGVGILAGAVGLGALAALPAAGRIAETNRPALVITLSLASTAVPLAALVSIRSTALACVALVVLGAGVVVFEVLSVVLLQRLSRRHMLGRVFGLVGTASNAGKLLGALVAPILAAAFGIGGAFLVCGVAVGVSAAVSVPGLIVLGRSTRLRREQLRPITEVLAQVGLFEGASQLVLERVAAAIETEAVGSATTMVNEGDPADDLFIIRDGAFVVTRGGNHLNVLGTGEWFGEIGLLQHRPRVATVASCTDAVVWRIPGETFLSALQEVAAEPSALVEVMADRLGWLPPD